MFFQAYANRTPEIRHKPCDELSELDQARPACWRTDTVTLNENDIELPDVLTETARS